MNPTPTATVTAPVSPLPAGLPPAGTAPPTAVHPPNPKKGARWKNAWVKTKEFWGYWGGLILPICGIFVAVLSILWLIHWWNKDKVPAEEVPVVETSPSQKPIVSPSRDDPEKEEMRRENARLKAEMKEKADTKIVEDKTRKEKEADKVAFNSPDPVLDIIMPPAIVGLKDPPRSAPTSPFITNSTPQSFKPWSEVKADGDWTVVPKDVSPDGYTADEHWLHHVAEVLAADEKAGHGEHLKALIGAKKYKIVDGVQVNNPSYGRVILHPKDEDKLRPDSPRGVLYRQVRDFAVGHGFPGFGLVSRDSNLAKLKAGLLAEFPSEQSKDPLAHK